PDYYVVATRTTSSPGLNCSSAPFKVEIKDRREYPVLSFTTVDNTTCNNVFDARIELAAQTAGVGNGSNYDIDWTGPGAPSSIADAPDVVASTATPYVTPATDNIGPGTYTV